MRLPSGVEEVEAAPNAPRSEEVGRSHLDVD